MCAQGATTVGVATELARAGEPRCHPEFRPLRSMVEWKWRMGSLSLFAMLAAGLAAAACAGSANPAPDPGPPPVPVQAQAIEHAAAADPAPAPPPAAEPPAPSIELAFVGDIMFGRYTATGFAPIRAELHDPFADVRELLRADLTLANLETPVMRAPPPHSPWGTIKRFVATPERAASLRPAGIDVVTLANN